MVVEKDSQLVMWQAFAVETANVQKSAAFYHEHHAAKCARAHFTSKWSKPSHRSPQGRPTLLLRACTIYVLGSEWREPAAEEKVCVPVPRQAHTRTRACVRVQPNELMNS
jgi:hypothetical protein